MMDNRLNGPQVRFILHFHQRSGDRVSNLYTLHDDLEFCPPRVLGHGKDEIQRVGEKSFQSAVYPHIGGHCALNSYSTITSRLLCSTLPYCDCSDGVDDSVSLVWCARVPVLGVVFHFHNVFNASI